MGHPGVRGVLFSPRRSARAASCWWRKPSKRRDAPSSLPRHYDPEVSSPLVLVMAAGEGTRMRSSTPKMLHPVCGRPLVAWPILAAREAGAGRVAAIVSPGIDISAGLPDDVETVVQPQPDGTGGAVRAALPLIEEAETVLVLSGDHPLISAEIVSGFLEAHAASGRRRDDDDDRARRSRQPTAASCAAPTARSSAWSRRKPPATPAPRSWRSARSTPAPTPSTPARSRPPWRGLVQRQRPGRVLPDRRLRRPARGRPLRRRPPRRRLRGDDGGQQPGRAGRGRGRGPPPHPRGATCSPASPSSIPARPGSTPTSRSPPTPGSSPAPACAARPRSAPARSSARSAR